MSHQYRQRMVGRSAEDKTFQIANPGVDLTLDTPSPAVMIAKITGPGSLSQTDLRWAVKGTDLGIMWDNGAGEILALFGDTFGEWESPGGGGSDWRSNILLRSTDRDLQEGMTFQSAKEDRPGHAGELIPSLKVDGLERTTIPTGAVNVGARQYLAYMSVRRWGAAGLWDTNFCSIAYSDDNGDTWITEGTPRWDNPGSEVPGSGEHPFQMVALARHEEHVYLFGTPNGRDGAVRVARVHQDSLLAQDRYEYWDGTAWDSDADAEFRAEAIVPPPVAELSIAFNEFSGRWLMVHLEDLNIVLRSAPAPEGPWSAPECIASFGDIPILYGGFIHPWSQGSDLYLAVSIWDPYNVFLMRVHLDAHARITRGNLIGDPGFERSHPEPSHSWTSRGDVTIVNDEPAAFSGNQLASLRGRGSSIAQTVRVQAGKRYSCSFYARIEGSGRLRAVVTDSSTMISERFFLLEEDASWKRFLFEIESLSGSLTLMMESDADDAIIMLDDLAMWECA